MNVQINPKQTQPRRKRGQNRNKKTKPDVIINNAPGRARRGPRRQRRKQKNAGLGVSKAAVKVAVLSALSKEESYLHLEQSLFSGVAGIHRSFSFGVDQTALCRFRQNLDIVLPANSGFSFLWAPAQLASGDAFKFTLPTAVATGPVDPYNVSAAPNITSASVAGPFVTTNPSNGWRVVRAAMRITPSSSFNVQGGVYVTGYLPSAYIGAPASGTMATIPATSWTTTAFSNLAIYKTFSGLQSLMLQWFPGDDEIYVQPAAWYASAGSKTSGLAGIIQGPNNSSNYHIELDYGIEYDPNVTFKPYVNKDYPRCDPSAGFQLSQFISSQWDRSVLATTQEYDARTATIDHLPSAWSNRYQMANTVGMPSVNLPLSKKEARLAAEEEEGYCDMIQGATGLNVCGGLGKGFEEIVTRGAKGVYNAAMSKATGHRMMSIGTD